MSQRLTISVSTWNVGASAGAQSTSTADGIDGWLHVGKADVHVIALQEVIDINSPLSYVGLPSLYEAAQDGLSETVSSEAAVWEAAILAKLPGHRLVAKRQLVGIMLFVLVAEKHLPNCAAARVTQLGTGPLGAGNKGAAAASLILYGSTLCIIGAHLAAGSKGPSARNKDTQQILAGLSFPRSSQAAASSSSSEGGGDAPPPPALPSTVDAHDFIIWCGDLNYRLSMKDDDARAIAQARQWQSLMGSDELRLSQLSGAAWAGFSEGDMRFPPTYKYDTHSDGMRGVTPSLSKGFLVS